MGIPQDRDPQRATRRRAPLAGPAPAAGATVGGLAVLWLASSLGGLTGFAFGLALLAAVATALLAWRLRALSVEVRALRAASASPAEPPTESDPTTAAPETAAGDARPGDAVSEPVGVEPIDAQPVDGDTAVTADVPVMANVTDEPADVAAVDVDGGEIRFGIAPAELTADRRPAPPTAVIPATLSPVALALAPLAESASVPAAEVTPGAAPIAPDQPAGTSPAPGTAAGPVASVPPVVPATMPDLSLTALSGEPVELTGLSAPDDRPTVVVFWRPGCEHSVRLTPELVAWESLQGPRLVVIAACDGPAAYRAGLPGLVLLDPGFTAGRALGARGTPAALTLGPDGVPVTPVVAGAGSVNAHLLGAMRAWSEAEAEREMAGDLAATNEEAAIEPEAGEDALPFGPAVPPAVLLRRLEPLAADPAPATGADELDAPVRRVG